MSIATIAIIFLGLIVIIVILLWLRGRGAASPAAPPVPILLDIHITYNNTTKRNRMEQWNSLNTRDYKDKPTVAQAKLFPCKLTVLYKYNDKEEAKVYYATPEAVNKLGFS